MPRSSIKMLPLRKLFVERVRAELPSLKNGGNTITRMELTMFMDKHQDLNWPAWLTADENLRAGRGVFIVPMLDGTIPSFTKSELKIINMARLSTAPAAISEPVAPQAVINISATPLSETDTATHRRFVIEVPMEMLVRAVTIAPALPVAVKPMKSKGAKGNKKAVRV